MISVVIAVAATLGLGWHFCSKPLESDSLLSTSGLSVETVSDRRLLSLKQASQSGGCQKTPRRHCDRRRSVAID